MRFAPAFVTVLILALAYALDLPKAWGAHPYWSQSIILIGTPIGLALAGAALFVTRAPGRLAVAFAVLGLGAVLLAAQGKADFAASYAEDRLAGRFWYFGWIATAAMAAAALSSGLASLSALRRP